MQRILSKPKFLKVVTFTFIFVLSNSSFGQSDSTDLTISSENYILETAEDTMMYFGQDVKRYFLEFDFDSTENIASIHVDAYSLDFGHVLLHKTILIEDLIQSGQLTNLNAIVDLGTFIPQHLEVSLVLENLDHTLQPTISKTFN